jgi:hypothetical protein
MEPNTVRYASAMSDAVVGITVRRSPFIYAYGPRRRPPMDIWRLGPRHAVAIAARGSSLDVEADVIGSLRVATHPSA